MWYSNRILLWYKKSSFDKLLTMNETQRKTFICKYCYILGSRPKLDHFPTVRSTYLYKNEHYLWQKDWMKTKNLELYTFCCLTTWLNSKGMTSKKPRSSSCTIKCFIYPEKKETKVSPLQLHLIFTDQIIQSLMITKPNLRISVNFWWQPYSHAHLNQHHKSQFTVNTECSYFSEPIDGTWCRL